MWKVREAILLLFAAGHLLCKVVNSTLWFHFFGDWLLEGNDDSCNRGKIRVT